MPKPQRVETAEIVDPQRLWFTCAVSDQEWEELKEYRRVGSTFRTLREMLYLFVGLADAAAQRQEALVSNPVPLLTLTLEAYLVPKER